MVGISWLFGTALSVRSIGAGSRENPTWHAQASFVPTPRIPAAIGGIVAASAGSPVPRVLSIAAARDAWRVEFFVRPMGEAPGMAAFVHRTIAEYLASTHVERRDSGRAKIGRG
jgi:hypothetical protein